MKATSLFCLIGLASAITLKSRGYPYNDDGTDAEDASIDDISLSLLNSAISSESEMKIKAGATTELTVDSEESALEKTD